jgi:hypothetical protein
MKATAAAQIMIKESNSCSVHSNTADWISPLETEVEAGAKCKVKVKLDKV